MSLITYDTATIDSTGAFLLAELERLDPKIHNPLVNFTYSRDIKFRHDVSIADEFSSYTLNNYANSSAGNSSGISWIAKNTNTPAGPQIDISKTANPLTLWGQAIQWTIPELESAQRLGRPIDQQKYEAFLLKYNMDMDRLVYVGDSTLPIPGVGTATGITNHVLVSNSKGATTGNWSNGTTTAQQILADVNELLNSVYKESAWELCPDKLLIPPTQFSYLVSTPLSIISNGAIAGAATSVLEFLKNNSLSNALNGRPLEILPCKWLASTSDGNPYAPGASGATRMVAYTNDLDRIRMPLVPMQRTPVEFRSIYQITTYYCKIGCVECVYPQTIGYRDGI